MTYKPPHPERVPDGGKRAHKVTFRVGGSVITARADCAPLGGTFKDRTDEYGLTPGEVVQLEAKIDNREADDEPAPDTHG